MAITSANSFRGTITVSQSLILKSLSSPLNANITLVYRGHPFSLCLETGEAYVKLPLSRAPCLLLMQARHLSLSSRPITSSIRIQNLGATTEHAVEDESLVHCNITTKTNHAPLTLDVAYTSPRVVLNVDASTEMAPLFVTVPPAFQGMSCCLPFLLSLFPEFIVDLLLFFLQ